MIVELKYAKLTLGVVFSKFFKLDMLDTLDIELLDMLDMQISNTRPTSNRKSNDIRLVLT